MKNGGSSTAMLNNQMVILNFSWFTPHVCPNFHVTIPKKCLIYVSSQVLSKSQLADEIPFLQPTSQTLAVYPLVI